MKDLDTVLAEHQPKPKRPLPATFTQNVITTTKNPKLSIWRKLQSALTVRPFTKAGSAALASMVLVSSSVAAVMLWPQPSVTPLIHKQLPSGNRVVGYNVTNCDYFGSSGDEAPEHTPEKLYYEVREGSSLTDRELQDSLKATCEENISDKALDNLVKKISNNTPGIFSTEHFVIDAITPNSITISLDPAYDASSYKALPRTAYTQFADSLLVYNQNNEAALSDLKAGDTVKMIMQDTRNLSADTGTYRPPVYDRPDLITIYAIMKVPPLSGNPVTFSSAVAQDLVRVDPCTTDPSGFCRAYDFAN